MICLCEKKLNGECQVTEDECLHAVEHSPMAQTVGGTCRVTGPCALMGPVKCLLVRWPE
jgi:hypothetical protein